jgi:two-component system cell cycle response regulator
MPRGLHLLLVCADEEAGHALGAALRTAGCMVEGAPDVLGAQQRLQAQDPPQVVVLAEAAGSRVPAEHCRQLRGQFPDRALKVLVAVRDATYLERAVAAGADEVLRLPLLQRELELRLRAVRRALDLHRSAAGDTGHDKLTGLWSHAMTVEVLSRELARAERVPQTVSVLLVDVDRFAEVNDQHGHRVGDEVLSEVAQRMKVALRSYDLVGRFGGDEFLVVLPNCGRANAIEVAERIRRAFADAPVLMLKGTVSLTLSVGVATTQRERRSNAADVVRAAEIALDEAKRMGRDRVEVAGAVHGAPRT